MLKCAIAAVAAALLTLGASTLPAAAAPVSDVSIAGAGQGALVAAGDVTAVQYRGRGFAPRVYGPRAYYGRGYGSRRSYLPFVGFGAAIIGGAIIADRIYAPRRGYYYDTYDYVGPYYYPRDYRGDPREICARHFRSFEWQTGLYTTYRGDKRMCPYLGA